MCRKRPWLSPPHPIPQLISSTDIPQCAQKLLAKMFFPALSGNLHFPSEKDGPTKVGVLAPGIPLQQEPKEEELELPDPKWAPVKTTVLRGESKEKRSGHEQNDTAYIEVF